MTAINGKLTRPVSGLIYQSNAEKRVGTRTVFGIHRFCVVNHSLDEGREKRERGEKITNQSKYNFFRAISISQRVI
jgi:hypothetical protein